MFHLSTHAFFKALLFLGAGSVIHALHEEQDIWKMGGLFTKIPLTSVTFLIGMLALSGFPPLAGFWSKDYLLSIAYTRSPFFYTVGVITAFLTAFYMTRLVVVAFFGPARTKAAEHPHESPWHMTTPLVILAVLSVIGGFIGIKDFYHSWSDSVVHALNYVSPYPASESSAFLEMGLPLVTVALGILGALALYWKAERDPLQSGGIITAFANVLANKFYFDEIYDTLFVGGQQVIARFCAWYDRWIIDGLIIRGAAYVSVGFGELLRLFQTGNLQAYAYLFTLGGILLVYVTLFTHLFHN
jgi:NADH-quinone oxidoreductase subunit L